MVRWWMVAALAGATGCFTDQTTGQSGPDTDDASGGTSMSASTVDPETTGATTTATTEMETTDSPASTGVMPECATEGAIDEACPSAAPYCFDGVCISCAELPVDCASIDPALPVCQTETGACGGCEEHSDCETGACRIATGQCFGEANRLWVGPNPDCAGATGTEAQPFCTVGGALATVDAQPGEDPWAVFLAGDAQPYDLPPDAALPERPFALIGPTKGVAAALRGGVPRSLTVSGPGVDRYLARLTFVGGEEGVLLGCTSGDVWGHDLLFDRGDSGVEVSACDLRLRRVRVSGARSWGIVVRETGELTVDESDIVDNLGAMIMDGTVTLRRVRIADNSGLGGIQVGGAGSLSASNTIFHANGYGIGHIDLGNATSATLDYVVAIGAALSCSSGGTTYAIRNSIFDNMTCNGMLMVDQSLVPPGFATLGDGNVEFPMGDYGVVFENHNAGDYHIKPDAPDYLLGIAVRTQADPAVDFDGDPRPDVGENDYPGVDAAP